MSTRRHRDSITDTRTVVILALAVLGCSSEPVETPQCSDAGCPDGSRCAAGHGDDVRCVPLACIALRECCFFGSQTGTVLCFDEAREGTSSECAAALLAIRETGDCRVESLPGDQSMCNRAGPCSPSFSPFERGSTECCEGDGFTCQGTACAACAPAGTACDVTAADPCCHGLRCALTNRCEPWLAEGERCELDRDCAPGLRCREYSCAAVRSHGESCAEDVECDSGLVCSVGSCDWREPPVDPGGMTGTGSGCDPASCNDSTSECTEFGCITCSSYCNGAACESSCSDVF